MKNLWRKILWIALGTVVVFCTAKELRPRDSSASRLIELPLRGIGFTGCDIPLNGAEASVFQQTTVVKRLYQAGENRFVMLAVDGGGDRHAIHNPRYCFRGAGWTVEDETSLPLMGGGDAQVVHLKKNNEVAEAIFWITDGQHRYASTYKAWWNSTLSRLGWQCSSRTPVLVLLQPVGGGTVDWEDVINRFPELLML
jgi:hypothetical protein